MAGHIRCRFSNNVGLMKKLGKFISDQCTPTFTPYFTTMEERCWGTAKRIPISDESISDMVMRGKFDGIYVKLQMSGQLARTDILLCLQEPSYPIACSSDLPISGFPRALLAEDSLSS